MSGLRKVVLAAGVALGGIGLAHADVIELTDASKLKPKPGTPPNDGVTMISKSSIDPSCEGELLGHAGAICIRGRFILPKPGPNGVRDFATEYGDASKNFKFEIHSPLNHQWLTTQDALGTDTCKWSWVAVTKYEIDSLDDIYWLLSDRGSPQRYGPTLALKALNAAIDPDGKMGISDGTAIPPLPGGSVPNEGVVSSFLITTGKLTVTERKNLRDARLKSQPKGAPNKAWSSLDPLNVELSPEQVMNMLLEELARTHPGKWVEFAQVRDESGAITDPLGVRTAARATAQWICETLSNAVDDAVQGGRVGRNHETPAPWVHDYAFAARRALIVALERADPVALKKHQAKDPLLLVSAPQDPVRLTDLDLADAALDVLYHKADKNDDKADTCGVWSVRAEDVSRLVDALIACASTSPTLGADSSGKPLFEPSTAGPLQDALATRALDTLSSLPNARPANFQPSGNGQDDPGAPFREALETAFSRSAPGSPRAATARQALVNAGFGTVAEVQSTIDRLFSTAISARPAADGSNLARQQAVDAVKALAARLAQGEIGAATQKAIADHLADLKARQSSGEGDANEKAVLDAYNAR